MENSTKSAVRTLSDFKGYDLLWHRTAMVLVKANDRIEIEEVSKTDFKIGYKVNDELQSITIRKEMIYGIVLQLIDRRKPEEVDHRERLITLKILDEEEGPKDSWQLRIIRAFGRVDKRESKFENLGGNRILVSVYRNLLILEDDICFYASNVFARNKNDLQHWLYAHAG